MANQKRGKVYLVGGGPGDPGLISWKGVRCLREADFILYDGLVNPLILRHTRAQAERTARADQSGQRTLQQEEINQRLIDEAMLGKTVVRLKGGDPYIFGRGSEEAAALADAGIEYEVVPGITAATAAAEYAGFSLTHRDHASAVCLITGHEDPTKSESALDYEVLAKFPGTLVFYMGLHRIGQITESLVAAGMSPSTPAAVITRASTPAQRVVTDTVTGIAERVKQQKLRPPSLIVVGDCVSLRKRLAWFEDRPLFGLSIGITRPAAQAEPQIERIVELGGQPVVMPVIDIVPPTDWAETDQILSRLDEFEWIVFTSANGVHSFLGRLWEYGLDTRAIHCKLACIGSATAEALHSYHLRADLVPEDFCSEGLAAALIQRKPQGPVLWARANRGRDVLPKRLAAAGISLETVVVYHHVDQTEFDERASYLLDRGEVHWIGLSSPAIATQLANMLTEDQKQTLGTTMKLAAISPITAAAAKEAGLPVHATAKEFTWDGILQAIQSHVQQHA